MMKTTIARSSAEMDALRPLWDELYRQQATATLFQSFAWNRLAAECFGDREAPYVVAMETASGAAIIPAVINRDGIALAGEKLFDYRDVLCGGDLAALQAGWARLAELGLPIHVTALRATDAGRHWSDLHPTPFAAAPQVLLRDISADQFGLRHARMAVTLRRLARQGASLHRHCGAAAELVRWIYRQKARQLEVRGNVFDDHRRIDFMCAAAAMDPAAFDVYTLQVEGNPISALVTLRDREVRRFYTIWFDHGWARRSPGTALLFEITRRSLVEGLDCDYMTGEQPHKARFMTARVPLLKVQASAETLGEMGWPTQMAA